MTATMNGKVKKSLAPEKLKELGIERKNGNFGKEVKVRNGI